VTVAWGLPYFDRFVPGAALKTIPHDRRAGKSALLPARRFPSDPVGTVLEEKDVAILLRSDVKAHVDDAVARIRHASLLQVTSMRTGFAGQYCAGARAAHSERNVTATSAAALSVECIDRVRVP